jgi:anti-sigma-K factor RskA
MTERMPLEMRCGDVDDLAGAAAVGALEPAEAAEVGRHLETCDQPHAELRELLGADAALAATADRESPSPALRDRILTTAAGTAQEHRLVTDQAEDAAPTGRFGWSSLNLWRGLAAAAAVGVLALVVWNVSLQQQVAERDAALTAIADVVVGGQPAHLVTGPAGSGYLIETEDGGATFLVAGLAELEAGELYELWLLDAAGTPLAVGTINQPDPQLAVAELERGLAGFTTFAVTVEQGRVDAPTSEPVMVAAITD